MNFALPEAAQAALPTLRLLTCGSVDDGKSTLIGRLLYEEKLIFDDQLSALERELEEIRNDRERRRFRAACRWARSGARTGDHDRRRLSLLRNGEALVHRRGHARPRAIYPQHGDRRVHRRPRNRARRRAQGAADADPSPFHHCFAARRAPRRPGGQQDRSRLVQRDRLSRDRSRVPQICRAARLPLTDRDADLRPLRRQCFVPKRAHALVRGAASARVSRNRRGRGRPPQRALPSAGAVDQPSAPRFSRFYRHHSERARLAGRPDRGCELRPSEQGQAHFCRRS